MRLKPAMPVMPDMDAEEIVVDAAQEADPVEVTVSE